VKKRNDCQNFGRRNKRKEKIMSKTEFIHAKVQEACSTDRLRHLLHPADGSYAESMCFLLAEILWELREKETVKTVKTMPSPLQQNFALTLGDWKLVHRAMDYIINETESSSWSMRGRNLLTDAEHAKLVLMNEALSKLLE